MPSSEDDEPVGIITMGYPALPARANSLFPPISKSCGHGYSRNSRQVTGGSEPPYRRPGFARRHGLVPAPRSPLRVNRRGADRVRTSQGGS
jgi:hypothetical protein